jgi:hypothetical protein
MPIDTIQVTQNINQLVSSYTGRKGEAGYDQSKTMRNHPRNREYVWKDKRHMGPKLLDTILNGLYILPIICSKTIVAGQEVLEILDGGNRMNTMWDIYHGKFGELTPDQLFTFKSYTIQLVIMSGLTSKNICEQFRRLQSSIKVTDGQLFAMYNESLLIKEAFAFLYDDSHPLRESIKHFVDTTDKDSKSKTNLENAVALISGALYGPRFINKRFDVQEEKLEEREPIDRNELAIRLKLVFDCVLQANQMSEAPRTKGKRKQELTIGRWLGPILYELLTKDPSQHAKIQERWAKYIAKCRNGDDKAKEAGMVKGAQNLTPNKLRVICLKVEIFVEENRIADDEELSNKIIDGDEDDDEEEDEEEES